MKQLLVMLFLLCSLGISAQDVIVKKDGSTVVCRVVNVNDTEITYKKWSDLKGSNYVMDKSLASAINYENGKNELFSTSESLYKPNNQNDGVQKLNDKALLDLDASTRKESLKVKNLKRTAWIGGTPMLVAGGILCALTSVEKKCLIVGIPIAGAGIIWTTYFLLAANSAQKKLEIQNTSLYHHQFMFKNGTTLMAGADMLRDNLTNQQAIGIGLYYNF